MNKAQREAVPHRANPPGLAPLPKEEPPVLRGSPFSKEWLDQRERTADQFAARDIGFDSLGSPCSEFDK